SILAVVRIRPQRAQRHQAAERFNIGHFFLALDPRYFRESGEFEEDMDHLIDALHATRRANAAQPVLVAGEPEQACYAERSQKGIPISSELAQEIRRIADNCGAPYVIGEPLCRLKQGA